MHLKIAQEFWPIGRIHYISWPGTGTDSLHIRAKDYETLLKKGYVHPTKIGYASNDCKNDAIIFQEINIAPKCYMYRCIDKDGNVKTVMKSKGIIKSELKEIFYTNPDLSEEEREVSWEGMQKVNTRLTKQMKQDEIPLFSIIMRNGDKKYKRTFNKNSWKGMDYDGENCWYPKGYICN